MDNNLHRKTANIENFKSKYSGITMFERKLEIERHEPRRMTRVAICASTQSPQSAASRTIIKTDGVETIIHPLQHQYGEALLSKYSTLGCV